MLQLTQAAMNGFRGMGDTGPVHMPQHLVAQADPENRQLRALLKDAGAHPWKQHNTVRHVQGIGVGERTGHQASSCYSRQEVSCFSAVYYAGPGLSSLP
jgi:hypothetical protein